MIAIQIETPESPQTWHPTTIIAQSERSLAKAFFDLWRTPAKPLTICGAVSLLFVLGSLERRERERERPLRGHGFYQSQTDWRERPSALGIGCCARHGFCASSGGGGIVFRRNSSPECAFWHDIPNDTRGAALTRSTSPSGPASFP